MDTVKPGWKTTEFWLTTLVNVAVAVESSGVVAHDSVVDKGLLYGIAALATFGYTYGRAYVKAQAAKVAALAAK